MMCRVCRGTKNDSIHGPLRHFDVFGNPCTTPRLHHSFRRLAVGAAR